MREISSDAPSEKSIGYWLLDCLNSRKVEALFANPGTEAEPILAGISELQTDSKFQMRCHLVPHEFAAVSCAYGHYLARARIPVVLLHSSVGLLNAMGAIENAKKMNIPLFVIVGGNPDTEVGRRGSRDKFIHWGQESQYLSHATSFSFKWTYQLSRADQLGSAIDRGMALAQSGAQGPVLLVIPQEILYQSVSTPPYSDEVVISPESPVIPAYDAIERVCEHLLRSERPLILTNSVGKTPEAVAILERFSEQFAVPVVTHKPLYQNFSHGHPLYFGNDFSFDVYRPDCVLILETDVPWYPLDRFDGIEIVVIQVGEDPLFSEIALRSFPSHISLKTNVSNFLIEMQKWFEKQVNHESIERRRTNLSIVRSQVLNGNRQTFTELTAHKVASDLMENWKENYTLFNEYELPDALLDRIQPGHYFRIGSASCLGWAPAAAIGFQMVNKTSLTVCCIGDGSYAFSNPYVVHGLSSSLEAPVLFVVLDNQGYRSIERETRLKYPELFHSKDRPVPLTTWSEQPEIKEFAKIYGFKATVVSEASDLKKAIEEGIEHIERNHKQYLIHVKLSGHEGG